MGKCVILINEINTDNPQIPEFYEFIELKKDGCSSDEATTFLKSHMLLLIKEYDETAK